MAVSPFDGANRIRFKGSLDIADLRCRLPIETLSSEMGNWQLAIGNTETLSLYGSPESYLIYQAYVAILEPFHAACNGVSGVPQ